MPIHLYNRLWLCLCYNNRVDTIWPTKTKIFTIWAFTEKFADSCCGSKLQPERLQRALSKCRETLGVCIRNCPFYAPSTQAT